MTINPPPQRKIFTSFRDNEDSIYIVAKLHTNYSKNFTIHNSRNRR